VLPCRRRERKGVTAVTSASTGLASQRGAYRVCNIDCLGLVELLWHDFPQILRVSWWVAVMAILWCDDKTSRSEVTVWMSLDRAGMSPHQHRCWQARCVVTTGAPQTSSIGKHQHIGTNQTLGSVKQITRVHSGYMTLADISI
jgi:hypothetical protein